MASLSLSFPGNLMIIVAVVAVPFVVLAEEWWRRRRMTRSAFTSNSSALLSYHTYLGAKTGSSTGMISLKEGELSDGSYYNVLSVGTNRLIYTVQLTFQTRLHVLGLARTTGIDEIGFTGGESMTMIELEGDFSNYFRLLVPPDQEKHLRYILDPEAMTNVIDFCRTNSWELLNDELYIVVAHNSEQVVTLNAIQQFIAQIRPIVTVASTASQNIHRMSKKQARRQLKAQCPICGEALMQKDDWHECPQGHGYLLTGQELAKMRKQQLIIVDEGLPDRHVAHPSIHCPVCGEGMTPIPYVNGHTIIDSCANCQYRWLDGGEQHAIAAV